MSCALEQRLEGKNTTTDDEKFERFIEVFRKALEDDESQKDVFYTAVLEWIALESPKAAHVRILSDAVSRLSYLELFCCVHETHGVNMHKVYGAERIDTQLYVMRLASVGLGGEGVRFLGSTTMYSAVLNKYVKLTDLAPPNEIAKHPERWQ